MATNKTQIRSIRLPNEICEFIDKENDTNPIRGVIESLYNHIQSGNLTLKGGEIKIPDKSGDTAALSKYGLSEHIISDIDQMVKLCGGKAEDFFEDLDNRLTSGELDVVDGKIAIGDKCPFDYGEFLSACQEKDIDPQKAIREATQIVWRS